MVPPIKQPILPFDDLGLVSSDDLRLASQIGLSLAITWQKKYEQVQLRPEIPVISTNITPFIECIIPLKSPVITDSHGHNCIVSSIHLSSLFTTEPSFSVTSTPGILRANVIAQR